MRKLLFMLCLFLICGCSSVTKIEEDEFTHYQIASDLPALYGGGYRIVEAWNGFKVEEFVGNGDNRKGNEIFRNDDFAIENKPSTTINQFTYVYNDGTNTNELYTGLLNQKVDIFPTQPTAFQIEDNVYFTYYQLDELVVNRIENGKLVELKRVPLKIENYKFNSLVYNDYEMYYVYKNENYTKFICDENEYVFENYNHVTILKDYIFFSILENNVVIGSYIMNRKTYETIQLEENIHLVLDPLHDTYPLIYNDRFKNNSFVFIENVNGKTIYSYGEIVDNTFKKIELPYSYYERDHIQLYDEKTIFLTKTNAKANYDFYVIEIK